MRVAVAGGTGLVGRYAVQELRRAGHEPVALARAEGVDLVSGRGLDDALSGCDAVTDVSNVTTLRRRTAVEFFSTATSRLLVAGARAKVQHHVVLSIVGVDRVDLGYYAAKLRQEELVRSGGVPFTVLRATQFHEFAQQMLSRSAGPVAVLPRMLVQPVAAAEVGRLLAQIAVAPATRVTREMAGPEVHQLGALARRVSRKAGRRRPVLAVRMPGRGGRALAGGALLPSAGATLGEQRFEEWLAAAR